MMYFLLIAENNEVYGFFPPVCTKTCGQSVQLHTEKNIGLLMK